MAVSVDEDVLRLQISVDESLRMQVPEPEQDLRGVQFGPPFRELVLLLQAAEQLAARHIVEDEVDLAVGLESEMGTNQKRVPRLNEHRLLGKRLLDLLVFRKKTLAHNLHRIQLAVLPAADQLDGAVSAAADRADGLEVFSGNCL
jgi:hypothetical protein